MRFKFILFFLFFAVIFQVYYGAEVSAAMVGGEKKAKIWLKDPFLPPSGISGKKAVGPVTLSAILFSRKRASAVINGERVVVGTRIEGYKVIDIKRTYVILLKAGKRLKLQLL